MSVNDGLQRWKLVGLSDDMEKVKVGSPDDMEVERMGSNGMA
jgi:hypothetical protein